MCRSPILHFLAVCILLLLLHTHLNAQSTSNRGTDFWVTYNGHIDGLTSRMTLFLTADVNTTYSVTANGVVISSGNIMANVVTPVIINPNIFNVYVGSSDVKEINKGINVTSVKPISLYSVISNSARTGSTLVLPTTSLEREYYVFSYQNFSPSSAVYSQFTVIGVKDNTVIEITPTQSNRNNTKFANVPFQITLNKGDVYQYQSSFDLTGTRIKTVSGCSPFAVYAGTTWSAFCEEGNPATPNGGDNLYQQLFPVTAWGKNFVSSPFYNTLNGNTDIVRIIVAEDNTTINVNGSTTMAGATSLANPYKKGSVVTFFTTTPNVIKASAPISVAQYQTSQTCNINNGPTSGGITFPGDPEMTILNPIEQTLKDITVYSRLNSVPGVNTNISKYYLNVTLKTVDVQGFTLDGASVATLFNPIANSEYSYAIIDVTNSQDQHRLKASGGFIAIAYGYGMVESYAYLAGTDLKNLKSNIQFFKAGDPNATAETNFCLGNDFEVQLQLPYITSKIVWNLNDGEKLETINSPSYTTKIIDGEQFYIYKYKVLGSDIKMAGTYNFKAVVVKPATSECATEDEEVFTNFNVFAPDFTTLADACINTAVVFTDNSPTTGGKITSYLWDFGDGTTSTLANPTHYFKKAGINTVKMTVKTDVLGCELTVAKTINIIAAPISKFSTTGNLCVNSAVTFIDESTPTNTNIVAYQWDFGDGGKSILKQPSHTFKTAGVYNVKFITTSLSGCSDTLLSSLIINDPPELNFKDPGSCVDDLVQFEGIAIKGDVVSWLWDFGDGTNDLIEKVKKSPKHKYTQAGTYVIKVTGTTISGCVNTYQSTVIISGSNPNANFAVIDQDKLCTNKEVSFQNNSTIGFGNIVKIEWIFDYKVGGPNVKEVDLTPTSGKLYKHQYPLTKIDTKYSVVQIVYSGQDCFTQSQPTEITVHAAPDLKFDAIDPICENADAIQLAAVEQNGIAGTGVYSGKGVSATGLFNPKIAGVGQTLIKYLFTSAFSCVEEKSMIIEVSALPTVTVGPSFNILLGGEKLISATATGTNLKYKWTPSEGLSNDSILNPLASPKVTTKYTLTVTLASCTLVSDVVVTVNENPDIPNVFSPNGDGKNDTWAIKYLETFVKGTVTIFNRFGQKVFTSAQYNTPWDGKFNGTDVAVGVYYYIIEPNNGRKRYTGSVTLLR